MSYLIVNNELKYIDQGKADIVAIRDDASLFADRDWIALVKDAGSEKQLLTDLGITKDLRDAKKA